MRKCLVSLLVLICTVLLSASVLAQQERFVLPSGCTEQDFVPKTLIYKLSAASMQGRQPSAWAANRLNRLFSTLQAAPSRRLFPQHEPPRVTTDAQGHSLSDLSRIYECTYTANLSITEAVNLLLASGLVDYAQPRYLVYPMSFTPNDPFNGNQYQLGIMKMFDAWELEQGDSSVVIAITDWGIELNHPDLAVNIFYNLEDPIDGIDNDNDGYTDNYYGWDMGSGDNNPTGLVVHGTYVSGCSSARTHNGTGVSGTGFRCKFIPIKVADDNNNGTRGYESIVYAADHGCRVINCSWGSTYYQGAYAQDIINYATYNCNSLVVAACGNAGNSLLYYPASYDGVLSVAGTTSTDLKWPESSYGYKVDVCAPGYNVWTTAGNGTYNYSSGTSFSSPLVAGAAALLWSHWPELGPLEIAARLKAGCDIIDTLPGNLAYKELLGAGRINMFRSLSDTALAYIEFQQYAFADADADQAFESNDTILLSGEFYNYLSELPSGFTATLISLSPYAQVLDSVFNGAALAAHSALNNLADPFVLKLGAAVPPGQVINLKLRLTFGNRSYQQYLNFTVNRDYLTLDTNKLALTISSRGFLGYNNGNTTQGIGLTYEGSNRSLIASAGFMTGLSAARVSDAVLGFDGNFDADFYSEDEIKFVAGYGDQNATGTFTDSLAGGGKMHLRIRQQYLAWDEPGRENFIILRFRLENYGTETLSDLYAGLYLDWDLADGIDNRAGWDPVRKLAMVYPYQGGIYGGLLWLEGEGAFCYNFDTDGLNGSITTTDGFSGLEKYLTLKSNRFEAGQFAPGNDIAQLVSSGPYYLEPGDTAIFALAVLAGDFLTDLENAADSARIAYALAYTSGTSFPDARSGNITISPSPFRDHLRITFHACPAGDYTLEIIDELGRRSIGSTIRVSEDQNDATEIETRHLIPGIYAVRIRSAQHSFVKKVLKVL